MSTGEVTPLHEGWRYKSFSVGETVTYTGIATHAFSRIMVPFPHIFRKAVWGAEDITEVGADDAVSLKRIIDNGVEEVVANAAVLADSSGLPHIEELTNVDAVADADVMEPAIYWMEVVADDASDEVVNPTLGIMVSPIPPGPA